MAATGAEPLSVSGLNAVLGASSSVPDGDRPVSVDNLKAAWDSYRAKNGPASLTVEAYMTGRGSSSVVNPSWLSTIGFSGCSAYRYFDDASNIFGPVINANAQISGTYDLSVTLTLTPEQGEWLNNYRLSVTIGSQTYEDQDLSGFISTRTKTVEYSTSLALSSGTHVSIMGGGSGYNAGLSENRISVSLVKRQG